jgi:hypothetical protein
MHKLARLIALLSALVLTLVVGATVAANTPNLNHSQTNTVSKMSTKSSPTGRKSAAEQLKKSSTKSMHHVLASPEQLGGTLAFIGPSDKEVTLVGTNGVPYDFRLTAKSRVDLAGKKISVTQLPAEEHKRAAIRFVPTTRGNLAESLKISAS